MWMVQVVVAGLLATAPAAWAQDSRSPVADAAQAADRERVRSLVTKGGDVNAAQGDGTTALHWAASRGDAELTGLHKHYVGRSHSLTQARLAEVACRLCPRDGPHFARFDCRADAII